MRKIAVVTIYDQSCPGARSVVASLRAAGHDARILHFKRQNTTIVPRTEVGQHPALQEKMWPNFEIHPGGNCYVPYPSVVTEREEELFVEWVESERIEIVGFTLMTMFASIAAKLTRRLHDKLPAVKVIWGGLNTWFEPEGSLEYADAVCVGEGEDAMLEYAADPSRTNIENLWFKVNGQIIRNPLRPLRSDLDSLPFQYYGEDEVLLDKDSIEQASLEKDPKYFDRAYFAFSQRGCPHNCHYCAQASRRELYRGQRFLRRRSPENFIRELEIQAPRLNLQCIHIMDDVFMIDPEWNREFCEKYAERVGIPWGSYGYPVKGVEEMIDVAIEAGMGYLHLGIQSGSDYVLKEICNRHYDLKKMSEYAHMIIGKGLAVVYDLLGNNPFENESHMRETLEFLVTLPKPEEIHTYNLIFLDGLKITDMDKPRFDIPAELRLLYPVLWYASRHPELTPQMLRGMADNPSYRKDPEQIAKLVSIMMKEADANRDLTRMNTFLKDTIHRERNGRSLLGRVKRKVKSLVGAEA
jgi:anaerobic magnesium-protoporphyrin IX monomethyl ester cyclase